MPFLYTKLLIQYTVLNVIFPHIRYTWWGWACTLCSGWMGWGLLPCAAFALLCNPYLCPGGGQCVGEVRTRSFSAGSSTTAGIQRHVLGQTLPEEPSDTQWGLQPSACVGRMNTAEEQPVLMYGHKENRTLDINSTLSTCWTLLG